MLSIAMLGLLFMMNISFDKEHHYILRQLEFRQLGHDLAKTSDFLTKEARHYTITGDKRHYIAYWAEVNETKTRDKIVERLKDLGATFEEMHLIETAKSNSDALIATETKAMKAVEIGDLQYAQTLMFGEDYAQNKAIIMAPIKQFQKVMNARAKKEVNDALHQADNFIWLINSVIVIYVVLVFCLLYGVFLRKVAWPLEKITNAVNKISSGNILTKIPSINNRNEIGDLARAAELFKVSLVENRDLAANLKEHKDNLELEVAERTKDLSEANDELEEFSYRTSHDLRSPIISSIKLLSIAEASIDEGDSDTAKKSLSLTQSSLKKLDSLIEDLLRLTETKNIEEQDQAIDITSIIDEALEKMAFMDGFELLDVQKELHFSEQFVAKKTRLNLIVENLISNAIKYHDIKKDSPYVKISTRKVENRFVLEIKDNGLGIPADQEKQLFLMFKRFHPRVSFGSGLGLYMMKKSADILKGEISFYRHDQGSIFRLTIPM